MIILALGSNIGDKALYLQKTLDLLDKNNIKVIHKSSVYETEPVGYKDQNDFYNMIIEVKTNIKPFKLIDILLDIESQLGRERLFLNSPRTIDIDIIAYKNEIINTDKLQLPHPRYKERNFVLMPLNEINPDFCDPFTLESISKLLNKCNDTNKVIKVVDNV